MSWGDLNRSGLIALVLALAAACQPLPRPFQPEDKSRPDLSEFATVADKLVVFVAGIDNAPAALDRPVADGLAELLGEYGIAASARVANRASLMLIGSADPAEDGGNGIVVSWRLIDADGLTVGLVDQALPGAAGAWRAGDAALAPAIVRAAAPRLAAVVGDADPHLFDPVESRIVSVAVAPVTGAPGDGNEALTRAMRVALGAMGFAVVAPEAAAATSSIHGEVALARRGAEDLVAVRWTVRTAGGKELGVVSQSNPVPAGSLDARWGPVAEAVAMAAADGLGTVLKTAPPPPDDAPAR